jgi:DNA-binding MarR family transcriptional regulator
MSEEIETEYVGDDGTENPTEISDITMLHPDDFASLLDDNTNFQIQILLAIQNLTIRGESTYGLAIKEQLEEVYRANEVHHGRLYPNLDQLEERGLIDKEQIDDRSNAYNLTPTGKGFLKKYANTTLGLINGEEFEDIVGLA